MINYSKISKNKTKVYEAIEYQYFDSFTLRHEEEYKGVVYKFKTQGSDMELIGVEFVLAHNALYTPDFYVNGLKIPVHENLYNSNFYIEFSEEKNTFSFRNSSIRIGDNILVEYITKDKI